MWLIIYFVVLSLVQSNKKSVRNKKVYTALSVRSLPATVIAVVIARSNE